MNRKNAMSKTLALIIISIVVTVTSGNVVHAGPSLVTQTQSFVMTGDARLSRPDKLWQWPKTIGLEFSGTPASIVIAGKPARLTSVNFDLTTDFFCMLNVNAVDDTWFSDCYTEAGYVLQFSVVYPDQTRPLFSHWKIPIVVHGESFGFGGCWANYHDDLYGSPGQSFSLSADDRDLSFLDVDKFTVEVQRDLIMSLFDWDTNDNQNFISVHKFTWKGDLTVSYQYEDAPVPTPVPTPSAILLLGSGLVGLAGFRKKSREAGDRRSPGN